MPLNKPSCRFSICNHLFQFLRGHSKSRPPVEFPYEPFKTLNHSHISYHGSPASVFSLWWCNPFARSAGKFQTDFLRKFWDCSGAKECTSCRAWKMLSNAYFLAKFRFDTAENEPAKNLQNFANFQFWSILLILLTPTSTASGASCRRSHLKSAKSSPKLAKSLLD